jgi:hypothetical protein
MDWIVVNIFVIIVGIALMVSMPMHFRRKNAREALQKEFEEYVKKMIRQDKHYAPYRAELSDNLNTINYWLKTGRDPTLSDEDAERVEKENRFFAGLMNPVEAKKWKEAVKQAKMEKDVDEEIKSLRVNEFFVKNMDPSDVEQKAMRFFYSDQDGENIYYCVTPEAVEKHMYRNVIFFTTARPTNIPMVYPHKYEGAQMLSLYKHPAQTVWFLQNWKLIRDGLEGYSEELPDIDESVTNKFDL